MEIMYSAYAVRHTETGDNIVVGYFITTYVQVDEVVVLHCVVSTSYTNRIYFIL